MCRKSEMQILTDRAIGPSIRDTQESSRFRGLGRTRALLAALLAGACLREPGLGLLQIYRARSRLYRNQILQENMRLKALAEIYTMHSFAQLCNLNFLLKNCQQIAKFFKI